MLVINEFVVATDTPLPVEVKWRFPEEGNLVAVAYEADGALLNTPFESSAEQGNWQTITLNVEYLQHLSHRILPAACARRQCPLVHLQMVW